MTKDKFWELIQRSFDRSGGDVEQQGAVLEEELMDLSPEEIVAFDAHLDACLREAYSRDLWGPLISSWVGVPTTDLNTSGGGW